MSRGRANAVTSRTPPLFNGGEKSKPTSSAPAHPILGMQRAVGNVAAQAAMAPPVTSDYDSTTSTRSPAQSAEYDEGMPPPAAPRTADPGYTYTSIPAAPSSEPAPVQAPTPRTADPGYSYTAPVSQPSRPPSTPTPSGPNTPDPGYSYTAPVSQPSGPSAAAPAPTGRARSNATAASGPSLPGLAMKDMNYGMTEFDTEVQRAGMAHAPLPSTTHYMKTEQDRKDYARGFDKDGKMINKSTGSELNTIGAKAAPAHGSKPDRHIFTMDGKGGFHSADAIHETTSRGEAAKAEGKDTQERFHHSSFNAGQAVAGAGELQVRDGTVELVSDTSGHYHPGSQQMMQTVQQLEKNNVSMERMGVEFSAKNGNAAMQASAVELLGYANHGPERAEEQMRSSHAKKNQVLSELKNAGTGAADGENLSPSAVKKAQEDRKAAQASAPASPQQASASGPVYDYN